MVVVVLIYFWLYLYLGSVEWIGNRECVLSTARDALATFRIWCELLSIKCGLGFNAYM